MKYAKKVHHFGGESAIMKNKKILMYIKERRTREGRTKGKESFFKLKLEQQNLFYNLVSLEGKVNLKSTK